MTQSRRVAAVVLSVLAAIAIGSTAIASPTGKKPSPPKPGTYAVHNTTAGAWHDTSMKLQKKSGKLILTALTWTETAKEADATSGICPKGDYAVTSTPAVKLTKTLGAHHQKVWAIGKYSKAAAGPTSVNVKISTPAGPIKGSLLVTFKPNLKTKPGQYVFSNLGKVGNADGRCAFDFKFHHS